jgi:hypothetical protein
MEPRIGLVLGTDALQTCGRTPRARHHGKASTPLAGSKTPGRHGSRVGETREALRLALASAVKPAWCTTRTRPCHTDAGSRTVPSSQGSDRTREPEALQHPRAQAATAEVGEGRKLAKGNAGQHHRVRTQGREARSRALDRGRQAAKDSGKRWTALWHHVYAIDRLREAYHSLKHDAAPGVEGQTWATIGVRHSDGAGSAIGSPGSG